MYSTHSGQRRGLLRSHSGFHGGPVFRNLPLFGFLAALVIFFYIFYVYQAQNAELSLLREQFEMEQTAAKQFKSENAELKAKIESLEESEKAIKSEKSSFETKYNECAKNLAEGKAALEERKSELTRMAAEKGNCFSSLQSQKSEVAQLNDALSAMRTAAVNSEVVVNGLNETIKKLREELEQMKKGSESSAIQPHGRYRFENADAGRPLELSGKEESSAGGVNISQDATNGIPAQSKIADSTLFLGMQQNKDEISKMNGSSVSLINVATVPSASLPQGQPKLDDFLARDRPLSPAGRSKVGEKIDEPENDGRLVAAGEYKNGDGEDDAIPRPNDEAAPDFENDEKRIKEPDV